MERNYQEYLEAKRKEYGDKFDASDLNPAFIPYFESGARIEVLWTDEAGTNYDLKRGTVGVTTGWKPSFMLLLTKRSISSVYLMGNDARVSRVRVKRTAVNA